MPESHPTAADAASLVAARQLAEEARHREHPAARRRRHRPLVVPPLPAARPSPEP